MKSTSNLIVCGATCALASSALAQALTARSSQLNFNYVYGAGGDTHVGSDLRPRTLLLPADSDSMGFVNSTAGSLPGGPYSAGVFTHLEQQYAITGTLHEVQSISASATTQAVASTTGLGSAVMHADNPGNEIILSFTVTTAIPYHLTGDITTSAATPFSSVALQRFNGFNWEYMFYSAFLPTGQDHFDQSGTLFPAEYRLLSIVSIGAGANQNITGGYNYLLDVPGIGNCTSDFNGDGDTGTDADIEAFFACLAGTCCTTCGSADFDGDGDTGTDADIEAFFRVLAGGAC